MPTNSRPTVLLSTQRDPGPADLRRQQIALEGLSSAVGVKILVIGHLIDLPSDGPTWKRIREVSGDLLVLAGLYPPATYWVLATEGVHGVWGDTPVEGNAPEQPDRTIWCRDLRELDEPASLVAELATIFVAHATTGPAEVEVLEEETESRWYPVINTDRCTDCLECLNFCLFGVYGLGPNDTIAIDAPDACRDGCPACARICPAGAILFPQHADPAIAGDPTASAAGLKMDLSQIFFGTDPQGVAEAERRRYLEERDDLDQLVDDLDVLDP